MKPILWAITVLAVAVAPAWSQQPPPPGAPPVQGAPDAQDDGDTPDRGAARISLINGEVSVRRGDTGDLTAAGVNAPVLAGDRILTSAQSRAEVQFDSANVIRLGPMTELRIGELAYRRYEAQLASGTIMVHVMRDNDAQFEIGTPSVSVRPTTRGNYRISVFPDGSGEITVRSGEAEISSAGGSEVLRAGKTMQVRGTAADPEFQIINEPGEDDFDRWNITRDRDLDRSVSYRYVPSDVYGTETLDNYGSWTYDAPYGYVWVPRVDAGWAPYREGRWIWADYYGWTWYSADPWGWAPYHYGNWYYGGRGWSWYPGAVGSRYYWRPALVAFFGWGSGGVGIGGGFGYGHLGWVPLAPYERFHPWYGRGGVRNNINIVNNTNITNIYRNARFDRGANGVTSVRASDFGHSAIGRGNYVQAGASDLRGAGDVRGAVPVQPSQDSRRFADRNVNARSFPQTNDNARFFRSGATAGTGAAQTNGRGARGNATAGANGGGGGRLGNSTAVGAGGGGPIFRGGAVEAPAGGADALNRRGAVAPSAGNSSRDSGTGNGWRRLGDNPGTQPQASDPANRNDRGSTGTRGNRGVVVNPESQTPRVLNNNQRDGGQPQVSDPVNRNDGGNRGFRGVIANPESQAPAVQNNPRDNSRDGGRWRQFEPSAAPSSGGRSMPPQSVPQSVPDSPSPRGGGRVFDGGGAPNGGRSMPPQPVPQSAPDSPGPRGGGRVFDGGGVPNQPSPRGGNLRGYSAPQGVEQQPVRINPPIVRERPNFSAPSRSVGPSAPSAPSAPRMMSSPSSGPARSGGGSAPAPQRGGGGGNGGGNRGDGGGNRGGGHGR